MSVFIHKIYGFILFLFGIATCVACFSYHAADTSFNTASTMPTQNVLGSFGAYTADLIIQLFGSACILIPIAFICTGIMYLINKKNVHLRLCLFCLSLLTLCWTLGPSFAISNGEWKNTFGGGFVGFYLTNWLGKSALFPLYVKIALYTFSLTLIIFSLNIPVLKSTKWIAKNGCTKLSKINLPKPKKLSFTLPKISFTLPKLYDKKENIETPVKEEAIQENIPEEKVENFESQPQEEKKAKSSFFFSFKRKPKEVQPRRERIEPTFTDEDCFSFSSARQQVQNETYQHYQETRFETSVESYSKPQETPQPKVQPTYTPPNESGVLQLPSSSLLDPVKSTNAPMLSKEFMQKTSKELEDVLAQFSITGKVVTAHPGPVVTLYEFQPAAGIKSARIITLADDIAMKMRVVSVRIAVIPGTDAVGIEMPNLKREVVYIREMIEHTQFKNNSGALPLILGKDIGGAPVFADLAKMPHLLVAGTTGSGKSVAINTMVLSLLYRFTPAECRLIMVDPKMVELSVYNRIPHLLTPVVVDPEKVVIALKWAVREMEDRYTSMSHLGVRNIDGYNQKLKQAAKEGKSLTRRVQTGFDPETGRPIYEEQEFDLTPIPYIVIIIDEMADLMGRCGKEVDPLIQRLAQMARAVGIHLILATQRPSVDVITGTIKSNFPSRMSFQVRSKTDSRTILDEHGAERLLGKGDMLFMPAGQRPQRVHGPFVSDQDVEQVVHHWEMQAEPQYLNAVTTDPDAGSSSAGGATASGNTPNGGDLYDQAVAIILRDQKVSTSYVQRQLRIGYNKAADLIDRMEAEGVISKPNMAGKREILVPTCNA
ncbi:MAG: DNA translocase FtsK 4TM domain-containing protein [Alphaproteobacteria bacterium]|nr:DNA translocase FtsK 4TM domain-containing protein [Alphaproteobacteria bacterium]